jgi:hypothetical protein
MCGSRLTPLMYGAAFQFSRSRTMIERLAHYRDDQVQAAASWPAVPSSCRSVALKLATRSRSFLGHHGGRGAGDEALARQLALGLGDLALDARDFLRQALALGGDVDLDLQHQLGGADDGDRRRRIRQRVDDLHFRQLAEQLHVGREALGGGAVVADAGSTISGTRTDGDSFISARRLRVASVSFLNCSIQASAPASISDSSAIG